MSSSAPDRHNDEHNDNSLKHHATGLAGKAFAVAAAAALCLPLLGLGQAIGIAPGGLDSHHYHSIDVMSAFNRPPIVQVDQTAVTAPVHHIGDTAVSFWEGAVSIVGAGFLGAAGTALAATHQKRTDNSTKMALQEVGGLVYDTSEDISSGSSSYGYGGSNAGFRPGDGVAGAFLAQCVLLAGATVAVPTFLAGKSVYDNFIRKPEKGPGIA